MNESEVCLSFATIEDDVRTHKMNGNERRTVWARRLCKLGSTILQYAARINTENLRDENHVIKIF